jgi:nitrogen fixation protein FixH
MRELTGRRVALIACGAFGVIIAVNVLLAVLAVDTFSGTVVDNSYVSSQTFDGDLAAQRALGWTTEPRVTGRRLELDFIDAAGEPARPAKIAVTLGRQGTNAEDAPSEIEETERGYLMARVLDAGGWRAEIQAEAVDGTRFRQTRLFTVGGE